MKKILVVVMLLPYNLFSKIGKTMVFKAEGEVAARLNRYFVDSAYLSSYDTRRQFFFGINEALILK